LAHAAGLRKARLYLNTTEVLQPKDRNAIPPALRRIKTTIALPSGGEIGLYQPTHLTAI
jgi:hypothetical protein